MFARNRIRSQFVIKRPGLLLTAVQKSLLSLYYYSELIVSKGQQYSRCTAHRCTYSHPTAPSYPAFRRDSLRCVIIVAPSACAARRRQPSSRGADRLPTYPALLTHCSCSRIRGALHAAARVELLGVPQRATHPVQHPERLAERTLLRAAGSHAGGWGAAQAAQAARQPQRARHGRSGGRGGPAPL